MNFRPRKCKARILNLGTFLLSYLLFQRDLIHILILSEYFDEGNLFLAKAFNSRINIFLGFPS